MDVSKLFEPSKIRRLSKDETIALYKRHLMAQMERAEAAEARCARLQQALVVCGEHLEDCCRSDIDWRAQNESHDAAVRALAGPDTPADSQPEEPTT